MDKAKEGDGALKVFIVGRETTCDECKENLGTKAWVTLAGDKGALCMDCADIAHLVFLPSGDAALTRRAKKHSALDKAVVLKWAHARKRYEGQGLLVEEPALDKAEAECLADADVRQRQQARASLKRAEVDRKFVAAFAGRVRALYPACPKSREHVIAEHACQKYSGRVGRSASAKDLEEHAVRLAVEAHVRHAETRYDTLLAGGTGRQKVRTEVRGELDAVLAKWGGGS